MRGAGLAPAARFASETIQSQVKSKVNPMMQGRRLRRGPQIPRGTGAGPSGGWVRVLRWRFVRWLRWVPLGHVVSRKRYSAEPRESSPRRHL